MIYTFKDSNDHYRPTMHAAIPDKKYDVDNFTLKVNTMRGEFDFYTERLLHKESQQTFSYIVKHGEVLINDDGTLPTWTPNSDVTSRGSFDINGTRFKVYKTTKLEPPYGTHFANLSTTSHHVSIAGSAINAAYMYIKDKKDTSLVVLVDPRTYGRIFVGESKYNDIRDAVNLLILGTFDILKYVKHCVNVYDRKLGCCLNIYLAETPIMFNGNSVGELYSRLIKEVDICNA